MPQTIIDLDIFDDVGVKLGGKVYALPGDIDIPRLRDIERLMGELEGTPAEGEDDERGSAFTQLYDEVLELFRIRQPDLEELKIGARQLGVLVLRLYTTAAERDEREGGDRPPKRSTRSTSPKKRSRGSKS